MIEKDHTKYFVFDFIVPIICSLFFSWVAYISGSGISESSNSGILTFLLCSFCVLVVLFCVFYFLWSFKNWEIINNKLTCVR